MIKSWCKTFVHQERLIKNMVSRFIMFSIILSLSLSLSNKKNKTESFPHGRKKLQDNPRKSENLLCSNKHFHNQLSSGQPSSNFYIFIGSLGYKGVKQNPQPPSKCRIKKLQKITMKQHLQNIRSSKNQNIKKHS